MKYAAEQGKPTGATINGLLCYHCFKDPSKCRCFEKRHLLLEFLLPLPFTLTTVLLAAWTDLPTLSPSILCKGISDNTQQWTNRIYPGSRETEEKIRWQKQVPKRCFQYFCLQYLAPCLSTPSSTHIKNLASLYLMSGSSEFVLRRCLTTSASTCTQAAW